MWILNKLETWINNNCSPNIEWEDGSIQVDARSVKKGDLYICVKGAYTDGHEYIDEAYNNGASIILASDQSYCINNYPIMIVDDTQKILYRLAQIKSSQSKAKFIGITGSVGKTSTKEVLKLLLEEFGKTETSIGSGNTDLHIAVILANLSLRTKFVILEAGLLTRDDMDPISNLAKFDIVLITTIEPAHLQNFTSVEEIAYSKAKLLKNMNCNSVALLNSDNFYFPMLVECAKKYNVKNILSFGQRDASTYKLINYVIEEEMAIIEADINKKRITFKARCHGLKQAINIVAAMGIIDNLELDIIKATKIIKNFKPIKGRGQLSILQVKHREIRLIDDSYNASPASVESAIKVLGDFNINKKVAKVAILGDMLELGDQSIDFHKKLEIHIINNKIDYVIAVGNYIKYLFEKLPKNIALAHFSSTDELLSHLDYILEKSILPYNIPLIILVKGSHSICLERIVDKLQKTSNSL